MPNREEEKGKLHGSTEMAISHGSLLPSLLKKLYQMYAAKVLVFILAAGGLMYFAILTFPPIINITDAVVSVVTDKEMCPDRSQDKFPRVIHQQWKSKVIPEKWLPATSKCKNLNPTYNYTLWTDDAIIKFLETYYPWFVPTFKSYPYPIQRIDSARYFILYHYGGVYIDMDIECRESFDNIIKNATSQADVILGATAPVGITNNFMMSKKGHSFFEFMTGELLQTNKWYFTPHWTVMMSSGPLFVYHTYLKYPCKSQVHVASVADHKDFFNHEQAATWHSWDGHVMILLDRHQRFVIVTVIILLIALALYLMYKCYACCLSHNNSHGSSYSYHKLGGPSSQNGVANGHAHKDSV